MVVRPSARLEQEWLALAPILDGLVTQYKIPSYVQSDPIQIPYRFVRYPRPVSFRLLLPPCSATGDGI